MGYYIETSGYRNKAEDIVARHSGKIVSREEARQAMDDPALGVVVVVDNGAFEAAGFAYDLREFEAFTSPDDDRPKKFVVIDRKLAEKLSDYP